MKNQNQTAASRKAETFSLPLMRAAFEDVQNSEDWKAPIFATISAANKELTRQAVIHFTGTAPTFKARPCGLLRVTATGYRSGPCGDHAIPSQFAKAVSAQTNAAEYGGAKIYPDLHAEGMTEKEIDRLAHDSGFENVDSEDLDPALIPDAGDNWEIWARSWNRGRADAQD